VTSAGNNASSQVDQTQSILAVAESTIDPEEVAPEHINTPGLPTDHTKPTSPHLAGVLAVVPMLAGKQLGHCSEGKEALTTSP
jgi:hypothetical protein